MTEHRPRPVRIPEEALEYRFVHASGPGGQHVNKNATAVELRVDVNRLELPPAALARLATAERNRINRDGELIIQADQHRSQLKNRKDAFARLEAIVATALVRPKKRVPTRPTRAARRARLDAKKQRGRVKASRRKPDIER